MEQLKANAQNTARIESHYFTFGFGQHHPVTGKPLGGCFVRVAGDVEESRARMLASVFGIRWAFQYSEVEKAECIDKFGTLEVELPDRLPLESLSIEQAMERAAEVGNLA